MSSLPKFEAVSKGIRCVATAIATNKKLVEIHVTCGPKLSSGLVEFKGERDTILWFCKSALKCSTSLYVGCLRCTTIECLKNGRVMKHLNNLDCLVEWLHLINTMEGTQFFYLDNFLFFDNSEFPIFIFPFVNFKGIFYEVYFYSGYYCQIK